MLPPTKQMVLNVEYYVSPVSVPTASGSEVVLVGFIDYTVVVTNDVKMAREFNTSYPGQRPGNSEESFGFCVKKGSLQTVLFLYPRTRTL